jgi:NAD(P)-dependent dehydrogenase (short-subunit alcohol dehydrogenase family)
MSPEFAGIAGKRVIVTGPTSGIGEAIAHALGRDGAALVLACRDTAKGERVAASILAEGGTRDVAVLHVDVASQASIRQFADAYRQRFERLDVLVHNAGLGQSRRVETPEGIELVFATNVLGYHRLAVALEDLLVNSAPARQVIVASTFAGNLDLDDLQWRVRPYEELAVYAQAMACNRLWSWALARRLAGRGVAVNAMAPGFVPQTGLTRNLSPELREAYRGRTGLSVEQGADTAAWLAAGSAVHGVTGRFYYDRKELPCELRDREAEERLWAICESFSREGS